jgi:AraC-like DNA-binding protein
MASVDNSPDLLDDLQLDQQVRELLELVPKLHFFIKDRQGRLIHCNETHRRGIFRYEPTASLYRKENYDFFPNTLAASFAEDDRRVIDSGESLTDRVELNIASSGKLCWFCTTKVPAHNSKGEIVGLIGISRQLQAADRRLGEFELLMSAIDYIHNHTTEPIQVSELASLCKMPEVSFRREFKKLFRMTPLKFIIRLRLHHACSRLSESTDSIGDIACQCGFEDQNYFARQFRQSLGFSPTEFRGFRNS